MPNIKLLPNTSDYTLLSRLFGSLESVRKMNTPCGDCKKCSAPQFLALALLGYSLSGCALPVSPPSKANESREMHAEARTVRTIIYFRYPTADNKPLSDAISEACHCRPVFFRSYGKDALIYEIALQQGQAFAVFENTLLQKSARLGISSIEQDSLDHH